MARPSKLTPETSTAIIKAIEVGATFETAAGAAGIRYETFRLWMQAGMKAKSGKFLAFFVACERAKQEARLKFTKVITKAAADGDWRAALEYLKRHDPANWGDKSSDTLLNIDLSSLTDEQLKRLAQGESILDVITNKG